jgi:glycosyltransferase involved in cell wall biosynthesis
MTLRILYSFPHAIGAPGIGVTALNQVRALRAAGADVTVVATSVHPGTDLPGTVETLVVFGRRLPHRAFGNVERAFRFHDRRVASMVRAGGFDVVHTWPLGALRTLEAARERGTLGTREAPNSHTAVAYAVAEAEAARIGVAIARGQSHHQDARRLERERAEYDAAGLILVPSEHVERSFLAQGVPAVKLGRHQYGYDPSAFDAPGRDDSSGRPFTALFLGSAEPRKGLHYALRAWRASGVDGVFLIAGRFAQGYRERLGVELDDPSVRTLGFVSDTAGLLRSADVLVLPSVEEGSALVTYEALATGCIPLVSRTSGSHVTDGVDGMLHDAGDVGTLAAQLSELQADSAMRERMRAAGIEASASLTWEAAGRRMIELFTDARDRSRA